MTSNKGQHPTEGILVGEVIWTQSFDQIFSLFAILLSQLNFIQHLLKSIPWYNKLSYKIII